MLETELDVLRDVSRRLETAGIKFMLTGSVAMNYYAQPRMTRDIDLVVALEGAARGGRITLSVTDTGKGIAADDLPHIFDRFYRSPDSPGTGLGLAIAKNLVVLHGGEIRAESVPGAGTTVRITLPRPRTVGP